MKKVITLGLALAAVMAGIFVPSGNAMADFAVHSGSICHSYDKGQVNDIDFFSDGVKNIAIAPRRVICPLVVTHTPGQTTGDVYVYYSTNVSFSCTLYSYDWTGAFLGSKTSSPYPAVTALRIGSVLSTEISNHSLVCTLPANGKGKIVSIESNF